MTTQAVVPQLPNDNGNPIVAQFHALPGPLKQTLLGAHAQGVQTAVENAAPVQAMGSSAPMMNPDPNGSLRPGGTNPAMPALPASSTQIMGGAPRGTTDGDEAELHRVQSTGSGISQIHSPWLRIPLQVGEGILGATNIGHGILGGIPGTDQYHAGLVHSLEGNVANDQRIDTNNAAVAGTQARTGLENAQEAEVAPNAEAERGFKQAQTEAIPEKTQATALKTDAGLREHGFKTDAQGNIVPLDYSEMGPQQQGKIDLQNSQTKLADERAAYQQALQRGDTAGAHLAQQRIQAEYRNQDIALQKLGVQKEALGLHEDEFYNPQPTGGERTKGDLAKSSITQIGTLRSVLDKRPDIFGPGPGRANKFQQWLGSSDPDAVKYRSAAQYLADHSAGMFGARAEYVMRQLHDLTDERFTPEALKAALNQAETTAKGFAEAGTTHGRQGKSGYGVPMEQHDNPSVTKSFSEGGKTYNIPANMVDEFKRDHPNAR